MLQISAARHILNKMRIWWPVDRSKRPARRDRRHRLQRLARNIDALAAADDRLLRHEGEIAAMRGAAALEIYGVCADFTREINQMLLTAEVVLDPPDYGPASFHDDGLNLLQLNARGRILQIEFESTPELVSTENFRVPYILEGAVRCFNQQLLQRDLIEEQLLFYCVERGARGFWRFFDGRTYRTGPFSQDYLISLMEQLL